MTLAREAASLTSGTISYRINCKRYDVIEAVQQEFVEFCEENPHMKNWITAWNEFEKIANIPAMVRKITKEGDKHKSPSP